MSIWSTCCQIDEDVFLICWCFFLFACVFWSCSELTSLGHHTLFNFCTAGYYKYAYVIIFRLGYIFNFICVFCSIVLVLFVIFSFLLHYWLFQLTVVHWQLNWSERTDNRVGGHFGFFMNADPLWQSFAEGSQKSRPSRPLDVKYLLELLEIWNLRHNCTLLVLWCWLMITW